MIEILIKNKYFVSFVLAIITIIFYAIDAKLSKKKIDFKTYLKQFVWTFLIILVGYFILTSSFIQNIGNKISSSSLTITKQTNHHYFERFLAFIDFNFILFST